MLAEFVMMFALLHTAIAQQNPNGHLPITTFPKPYLLLIRDPVVHDDLQLSDRQIREISALNDELDASIMSMRNKSAQHVNQTLDKGAATAQSRLASILTPAQQNRLDEIRLWVWGMKSFLREGVAEQLQLVEDQRRQIEEIVTQTQESINGLQKRQQEGESFSVLKKQATQLRTDEQKKILAVITRRQQQKWFAMLGRQIDVAKLGRVKFKAPELIGRIWINSDPMTMEQLKGKVVALHFYAFG